MIPLPSLVALAGRDKLAYEAFLAISRLGAVAKDTVGRDGKSALTAAWNAGAFNILSNSFSVPAESPGSNSGIFAGTRDDAAALTGLPNQAAWALVRIFQPPVGSGGMQVSGHNVFVGGAGNDTMSNGATADPTLASGNTAVGVTAFVSNTTGHDNTGVGIDALYTNTSGYYNCAFGADALGFNTVGNSNVAVGFNALFHLIDGSFNSAVGHQASFRNLHGSYSVAMGYGALYNNTVDNTVGVGFNALNANTTGVDNTAVGASALCLNQTGSWNSAFGLNALGSNVGGGGNTAVGELALFSTTGSGNVALGFQAGHYETGNNAFYVDNQDRTNSAGDKSKALVYGVFDANPINQTIRFNAKVTHADQTLTLANGANQDVAATASCMTIIGPTGIFSIGGIAAPVGGQIMTLVNNTTFAMTINFADVGSAVANRIIHVSGANVPCGVGWAWATLQYSTNLGRWVLLGHS